MVDFARRRESDRRDVFRAAAQRMRVHEAIVEKDFWVCWVLDYLFHSSRWQGDLAFKGGTSLSKAYSAIQRFSEDIDLILSWHVLGFGPEELLQSRSTSQQAAFSEKANARCAEFLASEFVPAVASELSARATAQMGVRQQGQDVLIEYPRAFSLATIQPAVRLEIGPVSAWTPNELREIRPYAAEQFPDVFKSPATSVATITAERTFWEKATILHQEAHRSPLKPLPPRYSRHYYDLYRLSLLPIRRRALDDLHLLAEVVTFKDRYYHCSWARYDQAKPGSLLLQPSVHHEPELRKDYRAMEPMLFGAIPEFDEVLAGLRGLEDEINGKGERRR
jgi:hypothetical protein